MYSVTLRAALLALCAAPVLNAHQTAATPSPDGAPPAQALPIQVETRGPVRAPAAVSRASVGATSGQGFWTFAAVPNAVPVPPEAQSFVKGAHGTLIVDSATDTVYWGLEKVGFIQFQERLTRSSVVQGHPVLARGNLHGADLLPRRGQAPLIAAADNVEGEVYLTDTRFESVQTLKVPAGGPYADGKGFAPTDVAFGRKNELLVTDGYGKAYFMPAQVDPFAYDGPFFGGKGMSQTPHGITWDPKGQNVLVSARPEGQLKRWDPVQEQFREVLGLPAGHTLCDLDVWGDYALAPCLNGPDGKPGPLFIVNLKKRAIVSEIRPKQDLGYTDAQHMHDACWYVVGSGRRAEVYILFTSWNPGGIGALKLVQVAE